MREPSRPPTTAQPVAALTVTEATARCASWPMTVEASGAIAPWQEASIGTQIGGYHLTAARVNVGDRVRKGPEIGSASGGERGCQDGEIRVVGGTLPQKKTNNKLDVVMFDR